MPQSLPDPNRLFDHANQRAFTTELGGEVRVASLRANAQEHAAAQRPILRAIASSDLHNLVYRADYRIVPAVTANSAGPLDGRN